MAICVASGFSDYADYLYVQFYENFQKEKMSTLPTRCGCLDLCLLM